MKFIYTDETPAIRVALGLNRALRAKLASAKKNLRRLKRNEAEFWRKSLIREARTA